MKNQITSKILKFTFAFMFVLLVSSCSDDNDAMDAAVLAKENAGSEVLAKGGKAVTTIAVVESFTWDGLVCAGEAKDFCFAAAIGTNLQVQQETYQGSGVWVQVYQMSKSTEGAQCFQRTFAEGNYNLRYKIGSGGFTVVEVTVVDCNEGCDESFSYDSNGGGSYTFTYIPAEDISGLVVFTFAQAVAISGFDRTWSNNGQTMQKNMTLEACKVYTWTVSLVKDCNGSTPNNNIWTDFKVAGVSKKNAGTPNIVASCN